MRVETALLADYVSNTVDGKLIIVGVFDRIQTPRLPYVLPSMGLALRIGFEPDEGSEHTITVRFINPDGAGVIPELNAELSIEQQARPERQRVQLALGMGIVTFETDGPHRIDILIDGQYQDSVDLEVVLRAPEESGQ